MGIEKNVLYASSRISRNYMPYLPAACDIYAAPSRLEGFGMVQAEAVKTADNPQLVFGFNVYLSAQD